MANVRTSARRAEREQIQIEWFEGRLPQTALQRLHALSQAWLEHKAGKNASEMGFSMGRLNELVTIAHRAESVASALEDSLSSPLQIPRFLTALATTPSGELCAFVTFTPIYGQRSLGEDGLFRQQRWGWALDLLRRAPHAPPGVIELLLVRAAERFRARGAHLLSLGLVAQADTLQEMTRQQQQVTGFLSERIRFLDSHRSLFKFKQKFHPRWESRYLVTSTTLHLPKIAFALLRVAS
jgi:phosphatidylglycerol lysyltransferase